MNQMERGVSELKIFFREKEVSKKSILGIFETFDQGIVRMMKDNISQRSFEVLFFRNFFFLIKNSHFDVFLESLYFLMKEKNKIISLLNTYHYEFVLRDHSEGVLIFRYEIYPILQEHALYLDTLECEYIKGSCLLYALNLFTINTGSTFTDIDLRVSVYNKDLDNQDYQNAISFSIYSEDKMIYNLAFYKSTEEILISNLQYNKGSKQYLIIMKYHKVLLYLLLEVSKRLHINELICFSNDNHPCKNHKINKGFKGDYDNICKNIGMKFGANGYLYGNIDELRVKGLNDFIKQNIDSNLKDIYTALKI